MTIDLYSLPDENQFKTLNVIISFVSGKFDEAIELMKTGGVAVTATIKPYNVCLISQVVEYIHQLPSFNMNTTVAKKIIEFLKLLPDFNQIEPYLAVYKDPETDFSDLRCVFAFAYQRFCFEKLAKNLAGDDVTFLNSFCQKLLCRQVSAYDLFPVVDDEKSLLDDIKQEGKNQNLYGVTGHLIFAWRGDRLSPFFRFQLQKVLRSEIFTDPHLHLSEACELIISSQHQAGNRFLSPSLQKIAAPSVKLYVDALIESSCDLSFRADLLLLALSYQLEPAAQGLINHGVDINCIPKRYALINRSILIVLLYGFAGTQSKSPFLKNMVNFLIEKGAHLSHEDSEGSTAPVLMVKQGMHELITIEMFNGLTDRCKAQFAHRLFDHEKFGYLKSLIESAPGKWLKYSGEKLLFPLYARLDLAAQEEGVSKDIAQCNRALKVVLDESAGYSIDGFWEGLTEKFEAWYATSPVSLKGFSDIVNQEILKVYLCSESAESLDVNIKVRILRVTLNNLKKGVFLGHQRIDSLLYLLRGGFKQDGLKKKQKMYLASYLEREVDARPDSHACFVDEDGQTALFLMVLSPDVGCETIAKMAVKQKAGGIGVDYTLSQEGFTPLQLALMLGRFDVALVLIEQGADIRKPSGPYGKNGLSYLAERAKKLTKEQVKGLGRLFEKLKGEGMLEDVHVFAYHGQKNLQLSTFADMFPWDKYEALRGYQPAEKCASTHKEAARLPDDEVRGCIIECNIVDLVKMREAYGVSFWGGKKSVLAESLMMLMYSRYRPYLDDSSSILSRRAEMRLACQLKDMLQCLMEFGVTAADLEDAFYFFDDGDDAGLQKFKSFVLSGVLDLSEKPKVIEVPAAGAGAGAGSGAKRKKTRRGRKAKHVKQGVEFYCPIDSGMPLHRVLHERQAQELVLDLEQTEAAKGGMAKKMATQKAKAACAKKEDAARQKRESAVRAGLRKLATLKRRALMGQGFALIRQHTEVERSKCNKADWHFNQCAMRGVFHTWHTHAEKAKEVRVLAEEKRKDLADIKRVTAERLEQFKLEANIEAGIRAELGLPGLGEEESSGLYKGLKGVEAYLYWLNSREPSNEGMDTRSYTGPD